LSAIRRDLAASPVNDEAALRRLLMLVGLGRDASQRQESQKKSPAEREER
jgi:hypothetical protein